MRDPASFLMARDFPCPAWSLGTAEGSLAEITPGRGLHMAPIIFTDQSEDSSTCVTYRDLEMHLVQKVVTAAMQARLARLVLLECAVARV